MANNDTPFGFRPVRTLSGVYTGAVNAYEVADNYDTAIFTGDVVIPVTGGGVEVSTAAPTIAVQGVFNGCEYQDPTTGKYTYSAYYPASTNITAGIIRCWIVDDPMVVFEAQTDGTATIAANHGNFTIVATGGDTKSGQSRQEVDFSELATTSTDPVKMVGLSTDPENSDTSAANGNIYVIINNHNLKSVGTDGYA